MECSRETYLSEPNFIAQWHYLHAADLVWKPSPITELELCRPAFTPIYQPMINTGLLSAPFAARNWLLGITYTSLAQHSVCRVARESLDWWFTSFPWVDPWVKDVAARTVAAWHLGFKGWCMPMLEDPRPAPKLPKWRLGETAVEYRKRCTRKVFDGALTEAIRIGTQRSGERGDLAMHAKWTAQRVHGISNRQIANWWNAAGGATSEGCVSQAISKFTKIAGITIPGRSTKPSNGSTFVGDSLGMPKENAEKNSALGSMALVP